MQEVSVKIEPRWLRKKAILKIYDIGFRKLAAWTQAGYIRTLKFDDGCLQGTRLYFSPDLEELMLKLSAGHKPIPKIGRIKP